MHKLHTSPISNKRLLFLSQFHNLIDISYIDRNSRKIERDRPCFLIYWKEGEGRGEGRGVIWEIRSASNIESFHFLIKSIFLPISNKLLSFLAVTFHLITSQSNRYTHHISIDTKIVLVFSYIEQGEGRAVWKREYRWSAIDGALKRHRFAARSLTSRDV